jgi:MYXO-CTERM domain-containing protein
MHLRLRLGASALVLGLCLAAAPSARANGRFPESQFVWVGPGTASRTIVLRTTFGFAVSDDAGQSFHWICEEALDYAGPPFDPPVVLDAADRMHVGLFDGLVRVSADRCDYPRLAALEQQFLADLDATPDGTTLVAVSSSGSAGARNRVYRSDDAGESYAPQGDGVPGVLFDTLEMAPSRPSRIYLTGVQLAPRAVVLYRSDDGGVTLTPVPFAQAGSLSNAYIAGVDPTNPDRVFVRGVLTVPADAGTAATTLLRSDDGAQTFHEVARAHGAMLGFALSDDGRTVWTGGPDAEDGLARSDDGGETFHQLSTMQVLCLRQHQGTLYVCTNFVRSGYGLGRSMDRGETVQALLRFADLQGPFQCPVPADASYSVETAVCGARWPLVHAQFVPDAGAAGGLDGAAVMDAAPGHGTGYTLGGGGACATARGAAGGGRGRPGLLALAAVAALGARRRRKRTHPQG